MLKVKVIGHENFYGLTDVLRLFWGGLSENREAGYITCQEGPDMVIISEARDGEVFTYQEGTKPVNGVLEGALPVNREVKRSLYVFLTKLTGKTFPWGSLTGIRPTLVAVEENYNPEALSSKYCVREDKAKLACETAFREGEILKKIPEDTLGVYVGVPFCPTRCEYCSFISQDIVKHMDRLPLYAQALEKEIKLVAPGMKKPLNSVYMGGGTPTVFDNKEFAQVIKAIRENLPIDANTEFTVEAGRPDTLNEYKLDVMADAGIERICINPQTMKDETLSRLGRAHTVQNIIDMYELARKKGFTNINMDLIAGLKYEVPEDYLNSLNKVIQLEPDNITVHTLYKKRRANMSREDVLDVEGTRIGTDEAVARGYGILAEHGYQPYYMYRQKDTGHGLENTGFAKAGKECYYNVAMMTDKRSVLSFGAGGVTKRIFDGGRLERCPCIKDAMGYIRSVEEMAQRKIAFFEGSEFL
ncbi:MAG: coproporphyrinogen dehydrogenase HemZ [Saccharofermentans sp.]|nr:coproporphyrinogen dehydrogenase HemZ [Saccharofermentans sp.]